LTALERSIRAWPVGGLGSRTVEGFKKRAAGKRPTEP